MIDLIADFETSGLYSTTALPLAKLPHATEFYGALVDRKTQVLIDEVDVLIKPPIPIPADLEKKIGITNEMVKDEPSFEFHAEAIKSLFDRCDRFVAHNVSYDWDIATFEFRRLGIELTRPELLCTVERTEHLKGYPLNLNDLHEHLFGEPFKGAHRARVDVGALQRCYFELIDRDEI